MSFTTKDFHSSLVEALALNGVMYDSHGLNAFRYEFTVPNLGSVIISDYFNTGHTDDAMNRKFTNPGDASYLRQAGRYPIIDLVALDPNNKTGRAIAAFSAFRPVDIQQEAMPGELLVLGLDTALKVSDELVLVDISKAAIIAEPSENTVASQIYEFVS